MPQEERQGQRQPARIPSPDFLQNVDLLGWPARVASLSRNSFPKALGCRKRRCFQG